MFKFVRVNVEITQYCFLNCDFCPSTRQKSEMPLELFEKICIELKPYTFLIALHVLGDPLSVSSLPLYFDVALKCGLQVEITTVGLALSSLEAIMPHPALKQINFSLTSFFGNPIKISFGEYLKGIVLICLKQPKINPKLFINLRFWNQESSDLQEVLDELQKYFIIRSPDHKGRYRLMERIFLCLDSLFVWPSLDNPILQESGYCLGLKSHIGILVDGRVVPCCLDYGGEITLGDLRIQPLKDVLYSKRALDMRAGFAKKVLVEDLCKHCGYIQRFG